MGIQTAKTRIDRPIIVPHPPVITPSRYIIVQRRTRAEPGENKFEWYDDPDCPLLSPDIKGLESARRMIELTRQRHNEYRIIRRTEEILAL